MVTSKTKFDDYSIWDNWRKHNFKNANHENYKTLLINSLLIIDPKPAEEKIAKKDQIVAEWDTINNKGWSYETVVNI